MRILYQNTFDTTAQLERPLVVASGGGQVLHSGNALRIVCPSGSDCTWWSSDYDAPRAYVYDDTGFLLGQESEVATSGVVYTASGVVGSGQLTGGAGGIVWGECRINGLSGWLEDDHPKSGLIFYEDVDDAWKLAYNHALENIILQKVVNGTASTVEETTASGVNDPNSAPLRLRLYVNKHPTRTILNDRNAAMSPGQIAAYYSDTDGVLWTKVGSNQSAGINVDAAGFGVFAKRSSSTVTTDAWADFDALKVAASEAHELAYWPTGTEGGAEKSAWEDDLTYQYDRSAVTGDTVGSGLDVRPARQTSDDTNYQAKGSWEDDLYYAFDRLIYPAQRAQGVGTGGTGDDADHGGVAAWEDGLTYDEDLQRNPGQLDENSSHNQSKQAWEDAVALVWDPSADWTDGVTDVDGRDFVQGYDFGSMMYYDTTSDPWHTPTQSGFHGVGQDGYYYYDGVTPTLYEPLATAASGIPPASWAHTDNPIPGYWPGHADYYDITYPAASGELRVVTTQPLDGWQNGGVTSIGRWTLVGDFDWEVHIKNISESGGSGGGFEVDILRDWSHRVFINRRWDNYVGSNFQNEGNWAAHSTEYYAATGFRLTRSGSTVKAYYWRGYWDKIGADRDFGEWNCYVAVRTTGTGNWNAACTYYNFRLNSGTIDTRAGWLREGENDHHSSGAFPDRAYFIASQGSLNIIDADTNKLWMRFVGGNVNAYYNGNDAGITDMSFHDGVLWVSAAGPENHGHVHRIDFTTEDCRYVTNSSSKAFGRYKFQSGAAYWGYGSAIGGIRDRNGTNDFNGDFPNWELPGNRCYGVSVAHDSNFAMETVAIATSGGVVVHYYNRWKFGEWDGIEYHNQHAQNDGNQAFWCHIDRDTRDLYWLNKTHFCYTLRDTYHAAWGGTYPTTAAKELPTKLGRWEQYHMVEHNGYFYLATRDGVYRITDPTSEWQLVFGRPSSNALSKIITPACDSIVRLALHNDGGTDLLMILVESEAHGWTQVIFARLDTLALYAKSQLVTGKTGQPKALLAK